MSSPIIVEHPYFDNGIVHHLTDNNTSVREIVQGTLPVSSLNGLNFLLLVKSLVYFTLSKNLTGFPYKH